jgi:hypothetical protein
MNPRSLLFTLSIWLLPFLSVSAAVPSNWAAGDYAVGSLVIHEGTTYIATQQVTSNEGAPTSTTAYWSSLDTLAGTKSTPTGQPGTTPDTTTLSGLSVPSDSNGTSAVVSAKLSNLSTRGFVGTGDSVMIAGFIVSGSGSTTVTIRALGPTIAAAPYNVAGTISDPVLTIVDGAGNVVASVDNWGDGATAAAIQSANRAPTSSLEAAVQVTVTPGNYTAIVTGANGATGVALVEVYDEASGGTSIELGNLSTRGFVGTGDSVMIAGFIVGGDAGTTTKVTVRVLGPTIAAAPYNVAGTISDPVLTIVDGTGSVVTTVDNHADSSSSADVQSSGRTPSNSLESAHQFEVSPGNYTAIVTGANGTTGVALVEVYKE